MAAKSAARVGALILLHCMACSHAFMPFGPSRLLQLSRSLPPCLPLGTGTNSPGGHVPLPSKLPSKLPGSSSIHRDSVAVRAEPRQGVNAPAAQSSYYDVLGITMNTNAVEIKRAYAALAKQYHPDVTGGDPASTEYFYVIRDAYEVLGDEETRKRYNQQLLLTGYRPSTPSSGPPRGQELGMSKFEFYIVVILVNIPAFL